jgi:hypothetical protein
LLQKIFSFALLASVTAGAFPVAAQIKKTNAATSERPQKTVPKVGWTGVITYRKTLEDTFTSDEKLFGRLDERERIKHNDTRNYRYEGKIVVNDFDGDGRAATSATVSLKDSQVNKVVQTELTRCHSWEDDRLVTAESTDRKKTEGDGAGEAASYSMSVYGENFHLGFSLPEFQARYTHTENSTYSNLCPDSTRQPSASSNNNDARIPPGGASIDAKIDPKNPDVIEGSKTWSDSTETIKSFTHIVTWKLRRKPLPLMISDVRFYHPVFPSPSNWQEISDKSYTIDGNQVKVVATVVNFGATEKTATVNFKELKENVDLPDGSVTATIPANGQKEVELIWDTSGYAWKQSGADVAPETNRQIEARIPDDSMQKDLMVAPKPVVVVWGFWQSADAMRKFIDYFRAVSDKWYVLNGMTDVRSVSTDNADQLDETIRKAQKYANAWHVDLAAVQNGGLTARVYVNSKMPTQFDGRPTATHLIMMGVPNLGTPCATGLYGLSFKLNTFNLDAVAELSPESMKRFNLLVNNTNGTKFAALAVHSRNSVCQEDAAGDGLSTVSSAIWRTKTNFVSEAKVGTREFMGEVSHFRQVYKWLAVPPKGDHAPDPSTLGANFSTENPVDSREANFARTRSYGAMFAAGNFSDEGDEPRPDFAKVVKIPARQTTEIEIPVSRAGSRFSLMLFASPDISATLVDDKGEIVGTNLAASAEASEIFRTITIKKPFQSGKWKLRLESRETSESEIAVTAFIDYKSNVFANK